MSTVNGLVIVWRGWCGPFPESFTEVGAAAREIIENDPHTKPIRIESVSPTSERWIDCEDEVMDEVARLRIEIEEQRRHDAGTRAMVRC